MRSLRIRPNHESDLGYSRYSIKRFSFFYSWLFDIFLYFLLFSDLFYTRVAPSKTFDLLKDDFDYYLITVVLAALIVATYSTKYFAARKMLKMAWK